MKRAINVLSFVTAAALFSSAGLAQTVPVAGEVVISAVYGGGGNTGARFQHDFIELFNKSTTAKDISGFTVQRTGNAAAFPITAGVGNISLPFPANTILQPGQYVLVRCAAGTTIANGEAMPAPFIDNTANGGGLTLSATGAKVVLANVATGATAFNASSVIDFVSYGGSGTTGGEATPAPLLTNTTMLVRKGSGCTDTDNSANDFDIVSVAPATTIVPRTTASPVNVCGVPVPDLALTLATGNCGLTSGSSVTVVATASNPGTLAANGSVVTITLPASVTSVAAPGATVAGNVITWSPGNLAIAASATLNITATVNAQGTFVATATAPTLVGEVATANNSATARNFIPFSGTGYSTVVTPLFVVVPNAYETANGWNAGTLGEFNDGLGAVKARNLPGRPVASADGNRVAFFIEGSNGDSGTTLARNFDGALLAGQISGGTLTTTLIANEGATVVDPANPSRFLRSGVAFPAALTAPAINNAGQFVFATQTIASSGETNPTSVVVRGDVANPTSFTVVARQGDAATGVGAGINWGPATPGTNTSVFNATTVQSNGSVSFTGTISGAGVTTATDFAGVSADGANLVARKGISVPSGLQGTNNLAPITSIDATAAGVLSYSVDASGNNSLVSGRALLAGGGTTADDAFVAVNGATVLQEGFPIAGSGEPSNVATFDSAFMQPDGSWYAVGNFAPVLPAATGAGFIVRNGVLLAQSGDPIVPGSTELWSGAINSRTFQGFASNGNDIVIAGFTANADGATDNVLVWRNGANAQVLLREGQAVTINNRQFFIGNLAPRFRGQAWVTSDRKLAMFTSFFEASNVCANNYDNLVSGIVTVDLPATGPVCNNPSNVSGPGQDTVNIDAALTADDIIVFLNRFFAGNLASDVSGPGQNTNALDGQLTADDIIVFLNRFFAGC